MALPIEYPLIKRIHELIKNHLGEKKVIKKFYVGPPEEVGNMETPAIITELSNVKIRLGPTGMDIYSFTVDMFVLMSKTKALKGGSRTGAHATPNYEQLLNLVIGIDTTGPYAVNKKTIIGALREHLHLSGETLNTNDTEVVMNNDIAIDILPSDTQGNFYQAHITLDMSMFVQIPSRT